MRNEIKRPTRLRRAGRLEPATPFASFHDLVAARGSLPLNSVCRLNRVAGDQFFDKFGQSVIGIGADYFFGDLDQIGMGIAHRNAQAGVFHHCQVVDAVTDGDDLPGFDVMALGDVQDSGPFIDRRVEYLDDTDGSAEEAVAHDALAEGLLEFGVDGLDDGGVADNSYADGVFVGVSGQAGFALVCGLGGFKPGGGGIVEREFAADEIIDACGFGVLQRQGGDFARFEESADFAGELRGHPGPVEGDALAGVDDHRAADEYGRVVMFNGVEHGLAFGKIPTGREADQEPRLQSPVDGEFGARRDFTAGRQERSVEVDGNQLVLHNIANRPWGARLASLRFDASYYPGIDGFSTIGGIFWAVWQQLVEKRTRRTSAAAKRWRRRV